MAAHASNTKRIWTVFVILSAITIVEVLLGIDKPDVLFHHDFLSLSYLNWIFIILTLVKAYYIMWAFMHLEGEKSSFRWSIVAPMFFLIIYLVCLILIEGDYIHDVLKTSTLRWIF
ncbi:cytochrome C oxidase subunit IV family protein [Flavobacterium dauae]|uniref:cytochrome C oxidase subunit IV family protein n=1 Tax=Flavobacterium dauae TaxID=1563479 RepID=UPI00101B2CA1|nr:cytochrome C oxidase subunit IV family protein [Flavobacterium dauae]WLD22913.1 cytochrome C oxidase subunit IV family protein [Flavobacterium dauae]